MPATGRSYYPNTPGPLEQALAGSVADGTSVWGPLMMMSARHERQQAIDDVNETQAQQFMLGLKSALQQETIKSLGSAYGSGLRGGHNSAAMMEGLHNDFGAQIPQSTIDQSQELETASQIANAIKMGGEGVKAGAEGGQTPVMSGLYGQLGIPTVAGTPLGVQERQIAAGATEYAADRGLEGKVYSTNNKQPKVPAPKQDTIAVTGPYGTVTHYLKPGELSPDVQREIDTARQNGQVALGSAAQSDITNPTQDPPEKDPGWAEQVAALIASRHTNPVFVKRTTQGGKAGKMVEVDDPSHPGHRTVKFVSDPVQ